jgi:chemotaxis protein MotB
MPSKLMNQGKKLQQGAPMWVVTFGDLMSLLMCFFVLLLSFSELDRLKYKEISGSMMNAFGIQKEKQVFESPKGTKLIAKDFDQQAIPLENIAKEIAHEVRREIETNFQNVQNLIELDENSHKVTIRLMGESTFDSGKSEIKPEMISFFQKICEALTETTGTITIAGHTDNVPLSEGGRFRSNLELSMARAASVADFIIKKGEIDPSRIATMGFGEYRPIASNDTEEGRKTNRRVEIILGSLPDIHSKKQ